MNQQVKEIIRQECIKHNRHLHIPAIYKHFKEHQSDEQMLYAVTNASFPIEREVFKKLAVATCNGFYMTYHTELEIKIPVVRVKDRYYHDIESDKEILVMYTALYGPRVSYLRPLHDFLSKVNQEKYPNAKQKYKMEMV